MKNTKKPASSLIDGNTIPPEKTDVQESMIHSLLMNAPAFVCTLGGADHVFNLVNERYQSLVGKRKLLGKPVMVALPELAGQGFDTILDNVYTTGEPFVGIDIPILLARDVNLVPELRYFNFSYQPMFDKHKTIDSILVFGYEVTEQVAANNKNLENQQKLATELEDKVQQRTQELSKANSALHKKNREVELAREKLLSEYARSLIEASLDPLITVNTEGKITDMNQATVNITGVPRDKLTGSNFFDYFTDPQKARDVYQKIFAEGFVKDYPLTIKDHKLTDVLFNGSVYKDEQGNVLGAVVVARDITEQNRISTELIEARVFAELATLIAEEAKGKAESATLTAQVAVKSKQQFLSNMSHEIRTPMNAIIGFTKVLLKTDLSAKQKEYLTAIKMSGDALIVLINDILDLAKVDAGKMTFEQSPFKMALSISAMLHLFETKIQEKNLKLVKVYDSRIPEVLVGDAVRLHQIILNLVSNAVKFTSKGTITVSVSLLHQDDEKVSIEFAIKDTGIGISENKMETIFENFQQASSETSRLYGGTGLGLAIVKQLVEPQGGTIRVESKVDEGSTFSFVLSFQKTKAEADLVAEIIEMDSKIKNIKILVVEDIALNQLLMRTVLDDFGFECDIVANGKLAIEKLTLSNHGSASLTVQGSTPLIINELGDERSQTTKPYDIILMDLQMPEMNGFEATEYIRTILHSNIPIIALTADVTTVDVAKCKDVGMNDYIAKPIDERLLYTKIVELVKKAALPKHNEGKDSATAESIKRKYIDLDYLVHRTKANPKLMMEMISLYLEQTPPLVQTMKHSVHSKDWQLLYSAVHKMIPSFSIMGISTDFENMAKKVQEYASTQQQNEVILDLVLQLENVCVQACQELEEELEKIKNTKP